MSLHLWFPFLLAALLISLTPGPGAVVSMSTGLRYGYRAALAAILGLQAAILLQLLLVAFGLGALLATSEVAFEWVKLCGAAYLIWLGIQKWRAPGLGGESTLLAAPVRRGLFVQGLLVNLTNPKAIIFIGALVPQFIEPAVDPWPQFAVIALTLCLTDVAVMSIYALLASRMRRWLGHPSVIRAQNRVFGTLYIGAGVALAVARRPV
ncbi:MAG: homoserine/homoserine lactone efflux protein [Dechloromonas sp.]|nr:homoserine/homoserine lactone efflux protein [Dechloromonas sp.]